MQLNLTGLPEDAQNLKIKVYYTTGGRNATYTYITPLVVDPKDDDIDPVFVDFDGSKLAIEAGSVTNNAGTTESFGTPVDGTEYTVEISSDNYIFRKISVTYNAAEDDYTEDVTEPEKEEESTSTEEEQITPAEKQTTELEDDTSDEQSDENGEDNAPDEDDDTENAADANADNGAGSANTTATDNPKTGAKASAIALGAALVGMAVAAKRRFK